MHITVAVVISVVSVSIAFAVWRTSREKLRLDLYNRRFDTRPGRCGITATGPTICLPHLLQKA
ncbi:MAG: hypothetical protein WBP98_06385 [Candidatus Sulfotelmatobacter sp.]